MPITVNDGGVLRTLSTVTTNDGGVIHEMNTVHANDGGVLREIFSSSVDSATVEGITPLVVAEDHLVIVDSGSFTLSAPAGARIIVGGGAQNGQQSTTAQGNYGTYYGVLGMGGKGGYVADYILDKEIRNAACTLSVGASVGYNAEQTITSIVIDGATYDCGSIVQILQSKWGPIGGNGGNGGYQSVGANGTGAGGGGGCGTQFCPSPVTSGFGGNYDGYGNKGETFDAVYLRKGGKGGYSAGGGGAGVYKETALSFNTGSGGKGGAGIIVIEWDN